MLRDRARSATALAHAHERGVIHRDLKPENLLLDRQGAVFVIDFGLARFFEDVTLTNTGALVGTPLYMSPEQVAGRVAVDHRTDIYSLGMVLYELLTMRRPITAPTREGVLRQVVTKALPPVSWLNRSVSRTLQSVVHQATAKDPDDRYQSALALAADLANVLNNKPVAAKPYRYRFDDREIAAERPREVIFLSFAFMLASLVIVAAALLGAFYLWSIVLFIVGCACFVTSCAILTGRKWARLLTAICCVVLSLSLLAPSAQAIYQSYQFYQSHHGFQTGVDLSRFVIEASSMVLIDVIPMLMVPLLYRRGIETWLDFCEKLRAEHKRHASILRSDRART